MFVRRNNYFCALCSLSQLSRYQFNAIFPGPKRSFARLSVWLRTNVKTTMPSAKKIAELDAAKSPTKASLLPPNFQNSATPKQKSAAVRIVMIPRNATVTIRSVEPSVEKTVVTRIMILRETTNKIAGMSQLRPLGLHHRRKLYATALQESSGRMWSWCAYLSSVP